MDKVGQRVADFVKPQLEAGEEVNAVLNSGQTGLPAWLAMNLVGMLMFFMVRYYAVVVTDRRVLVLRLGGLSGAPKAIEEAYPRSAVKVHDYKAPRLYGVLSLERPTAGLLKLQLIRQSREGADAVAQALGWRPAA